MEGNYLSNLHYAYQDMIRHWHAESERYTGGDALCTALDEGWQIEDVVGYEEYEHIGARGTCVYYFELKRGDEQMTMPVIGNPYVGRLVSIMAFKLVPVTARAR